MSAKVRSFLAFLARPFGARRFPGRVAVSMAIVLAAGAVIGAFVWSKAVAQNVDDPDSETVVTGDSVLDVIADALAAGDIAAARAAALDFLDNNPEATFLRHRVAFEYAATFFVENDYATAQPLLDAIVADYATAGWDLSDVDVKVDDAELLAAQSSWRLGALDDAVSRYNAFLADCLASDRIQEAELNLANVHEQRGDASAAIAQFERIIAFYPGTNAMFTAKYGLARQVRDTDPVGAVAQINAVIAEAESAANEDAVREGFSESMNVLWGAAYAQPEWVLDELAGLDAAIVAHQATDLTVDLRHWRIHTTSCLWETDSARAETLMDALIVEAQQLGDDGLLQSALQRRSQFNLRRAQQVLEESPADALSLATLTAADAIAREDWLLHREAQGLRLQIARRLAWENQPGADDIIAAVLQDAEQTNDLYVLADAVTTQAEVTPRGEEADFVTQRAVLADVEAQAETAQDEALLRYVWGRRLALAKRLAGANPTAALAIADDVMSHPQVQSDDGFFRDAMDTYIRAADDNRYTNNALGQSLLEQVLAVAGERNDERLRSRALISKLFIAEARAKDDPQGVLSLAEDVLREAATAGDGDLYSAGQHCCLEVARAMWSDNEIETALALIDRVRSEAETANRPDIVRDGDEVEGACRTDAARRITRTDPEAALAAATDVLENLVSPEMSHVYCNAQVVRMIVALTTQKTHRDRSWAIIESGVAAADQYGDERLRQAAYVVKGQFLLNDNRPAEARAAWLEELERPARYRMPPITLGKVWNLVGTSYVAEGRFEDAIQVYDQVIANETYAHHVKASALVMKASALDQLGGRYQALDVLSVVMRDYADTPSADAARAYRSFLSRSR